MGTDKPSLEFQGSSLLQAAARVMETVCSSTILACGPTERYSELGLALALDERADCGAIAGVVAGLAAIKTSHALVIASDMPFLTTEVLSSLVNHARENQLDACFLSSGEGYEPLCAIYSRRCLPVMRAVLETGRKQVTAFIDHAQETGITLRVDQLVVDGACLANLNTQDELARARDVVLAKSNCNRSAGPR
ncbi:MAG: molybdopterin-guanine dinucleotide biosynthesis protein A [Planctomycetota bacterium]|jgi:molybdopterin-guanine dinucleotide biosynthesis protein A